jgi:hypothetical protein
VLDDAYTISYFVKIYLQAERKRPGALVPAPPIRGDRFPSGAALSGEDRTRRVERNKRRSVPCRLRAHGSNYHRFAAHYNRNPGTNLSHSVLGVAWTRDAAGNRSTPGLPNLPQAANWSA